MPNAGQRWLGLALLAAAAIGANPSFAACYDRDATGHQSRFRLDGAEATDTRTGLRWQRCSLGSVWQGQDGCVGPAAVLGLDEALQLAAAQVGGWRLPTGPELQSLVDRDCGSPVVDATVFPDIRPTEEGLAKYWSTSPVGMLELYWNIDFADGTPDGNSRGIGLAVRLVRPGSRP